MKGIDIREMEVLHRLADDFTDSILAYGKPFLHALVAEAQRQGVPKESYGYLFWALMEQSANWPDMNPMQKRALTVGRWVMDAALQTPAHYKSGIQVPPREVEDAVDAVLKEQARWCMSLSTKLWGDYQAALKKYGKVFEEASPSTPPGQGATYLKCVFEYAIQEKLASFPQDFLLEQVIFRLLK